MARNYVIQSITSMPFGHMIGAPMTAAIEAQGLATRSTVDFILDVGFLPAAPNEDPFFAPDEETPSAEADIGATRYITFEVISNREDPDAAREVAVAAGGDGDAAYDQAVQDSKLKIQAPLLSIVPIPSLAIDEMTIDFTAKISEVISHTRKTNSVKNKRAGGGGGFGFGGFSIGAKGSYSSKHTSSYSRNSKYQTELTMNVNVRASSDDMPAGLSKMLEILSNAVLERKALPPGA